TCALPILTGPSATAALVRLLVASKSATSTWCAATTRHIPSGSRRTDESSAESRRSLLEPPSLGLVQHAHCHHAHALGPQPARGDPAQIVQRDSSQLGGSLLQRDGLPILDGRRHVLRHARRFVHHRLSAPTVPSQGCLELVLVGAVITQLRDDSKQLAEHFVRPFV